MENKIVTFGEIMLRLAPPGFERFSQAKQFWHLSEEVRLMWLYHLPTSG